MFGLDPPSALAIVNEWRVYVGFATVLAVLFSLTTASLTAILGWMQVRLQAQVNEAKESASARYRQESEEKVAGLQNLAAEANQRAAELELQAAKMGLEQARLDQENKRLQISLEKEQISRLLLQYSLTPRTVSEDQVRAILNEVGAIAGRIDFLTSMEDTEAIYYANQLSAIFKEAGADSDVWLQMIEGGHPSGLFVSATPTNLAAKIRSAFNAAGIPYGDLPDDYAQQDGERADPKRMRVLVGPNIRLPPPRIVP